MTDARPWRPAPKHKQTLFKTSKIKTLIWTPSIRLFHWFLAFGFAAAYLLGEADQLRNLHYGFGLFVGTPLAFRLAYGLFGPRYAKFRDFPIAPRKQLEFA